MRRERVVWSEAAQCSHPRLRVVTRASSDEESSAIPLTKPKVHPELRHDDERLELIAILIAKNEYRALGYRSEQGSSTQRHMVSCPTGIKRTVISRVAFRDR